MDNFTYKELYSDNNILVVFKNHGVYSVPDRYDKALSLIDILRKDYGSNIFVTHRLDFGTSGVMIFAKNKFSHRNISMQFENHTVRKRYIAVTSNFFYNQTISLPIAKGSHGKYKINFKSGKKAVTSFYCADTNYKSSIFIAEPFTGRTHQIRIHLKALKSPLYYDFLYGINSYDKFLSLQCFSISLLYPETNKIVSFSSKLSFFMSNLIKSLELSEKNVYQYQYENNK